MRQRSLMIEHRAEIAHIKPAAARFTFPEMFSLAQWRDLFADDTVPRGILGVMLAILVIPYFVRLDRDFDFRAMTCPLDRA